MGLRQGADRLVGRGASKVEQRRRAAVAAPAVQRQSVTCRRQSASSPNRHGRLAVHGGGTVLRRCRSVPFAEPVGVRTCDGDSHAARREPVARGRGAAVRAGAGRDRSRPRAARREPRQQRVAARRGRASTPLYTMLDETDVTATTTGELHRGSVDLGAVVQRPVVTRSTMSACGPG